ncbi:MAG: IPT/TIG domain-containing protein, partial [Pseudomonadota bacterium]
DVVQKTNCDWVDCSNLKAHEMTLAKSKWLLVVILFGLSACVDEIISQFIPVHGDDAEIKYPDGGFDGDAVALDRLTVYGIKPNHGSFVGDTYAVISGAGFANGVVVRIGGKEVSITKLKVLNPMTIEIFTPAGEVGPADVEITVGEQKENLKNGYFYDPLFLDPSSGPTVGGTLVTLQGRDTSFETGMKLTLGGEHLIDVEVVSETTLRAKTPPRPEGPADLVVGNASGGEITVKDAFNYYSSSDPLFGGVGGGSIQGTLTISVLDAETRAAVKAAKVIVQKDRDFTFSGTTDAQGLVVFSDISLVGPVTVTAGAEKYETSSFVNFDARDVTIFLIPIIEPEPGPFPPGPRMGLIEGHVMFGGITGTGSPEWKIVPEPKSGQIKRTYVFVSNYSIVPNPPQPVSTATMDYENTGATAWPYSLGTRLGTLAIYALAGLYNQTDDTFEPYGLGITRGIVVASGDHLIVNVMVDIPLTEKITVKLKNVPKEVNRHRVRLGLNLGADGVILMEHSEVGGEGVPTIFEFGRQPSFSTQMLLDAAYTADAVFDTTDPTNLPVVRGTENAVQPVNQTIVIDDFVGVAKQVKPAPSSPLQGNTLRWSQSGAPASIAITVLSQTDLTPVWRIISNGEITEVNLPDPQTMGLPNWPSGPVIWQQWLAHLPNYNFNEYSYLHLYSQYWDRWSYNEFMLEILP